MQELIIIISKAVLSTGSFFLIRSFASGLRGSAAASSLFASGPLGIV
jgi:hypothetical protein